MFFEVELFRHVVVPAEKLNKDNLVSSSSVMTYVLENLLLEKASKDHGYFLAVTAVQKIGKGQVLDGKSLVMFHAEFRCRTFIPCKKEILEGVVHGVCKSGVLLRYGPCKYFYLSALKMPNFMYVEEGEPFFVRDNFATIKKGVVVRFKVLSVRWVEDGVKWVENGPNMRNEFMALVSIEGDSLGPVSLCSPHELEL